LKTGQNQQMQKPQIYQCCMCIVHKCNFFMEYGNILSKDFFARPIFYLLSVVEIL